MRGPGHPTLRPERAERVKEALWRLYRERFKENGTALATALHRSQPSVSQLLSGKNASSYETAERVAELLGISVAELFGEEPSSVPGDSRPNLAEALEYARDRSRASPETIAAVRAAARHLPDLEVHAWITLFANVEASRARDAPAVDEPAATRVRKKAAR